VQLVGAGRGGAFVSRAGAGVASDAEEGTQLRAPEVGPRDDPAEPVLQRNLTSPAEGDGESAAERLAGQACQVEAGGMRNRQQRASQSFKLCGGVRGRRSREVR
jgi:hypothetical protein